MKFLRRSYCFIDNEERKEKGPMLVKMFSQKTRISFNVLEFTACPSEG